MRPLVLRALVAAGVGLGVAASPAVAAAASANSATAPAAFRLSVGGAVVHGTYERAMSAPERPVPPFRIAGTLVSLRAFGCAVVQVARSGPADGLEWQTVGKRCGPGRTGFENRPSYLFRGVKPPVRLCVGRTVPKAERGHRCDLYQPPADS